MAQRIEKTLQSHPWLVAVSDGQILGYAYGGTFRTRAAYRWSCEVSAYVSAERPAARHRSCALRAVVASAA